MRFTKMHGAGNDFVVLDLRDGTAAPDAGQCRLLADRHRGVGCDQVLTIGAPTSNGSVASYSVWNADGSVAGQCGNGARCVAAFLVRDGSAQRRRFAIDSPVGHHEVEVLPGNEYRVAMGRPQFSPAAIPLREGSAESGIYAEPLEGLGLVAFGAVSMGNPHAVIEVDDVERAEVSRVGWALQRSGLFPQSVNVGFAQVRSPQRLDLRVYERGAGETLACGSGACAAAAVLMRRGRVVRDVAVGLRGGILRIQWPEDSAPMTMAGPAAFVFDGELAG